MAAQYSFITEPPKSRFCPICFDLLTEPYLSDCGHHLCRQCRTQLLATSKKECPECREPNALPLAHLNKFLQREINDLKVRCQHHREGCKWTGEVRDLESHLDPDKMKCDYILLPCSFGCGERIRSGAMRDHKKRYCTKRQMSCQYCSYFDSYDIVTAKHLPICLQAPVTCPNNCKKVGLKREQLQAHIDECPLQVISCPFTSAGCTVKLPRNKMEEHEDTAMRQHLRLVLRQQQLHLNQETSTPPAATRSPPFLYNQAPKEIIISDFSKKKDLLLFYMYTHNEGYKFKITISPNGSGDVEGSYFRVGAALMRGEYDDELEWPFEGDIRVELLNWRADKNHYLATFPFNRHTDPGTSNTSRITGEQSPIGFAENLISLANLASTTTSTEYLQGDCLKLRVSAAVYSTPLLHLTPAWQDPLISTQSGAQFTMSGYSKRKQFKNVYFSPPFTTIHKPGYNFCLRVDANGADSGEGSHLSIFAYIIKGQHDDRLQWPFTGTIIIELLNWLEDKEHYKMTLTIGTSDDFVRVTEGKYGMDCGYFQFISHSSLTSSTTNTQYLYQDCIRVRVQVIANIL